MTHVVSRAAAKAACLAITFAIATPALSQAPTNAQRAAIKSKCRSDYMTHCSSIPPGGAASLECLQKNMASLSAGCAGAVRAVNSPSETKAEPKGDAKPDSGPATATAPPAAEPASEAKAANAPVKRPSSDQVAAIRSACRSDYPKVCAGVPTGGAPALQCLQKNEAKVSAGCKTALAAAAGGTPSDAAAPATAGAATQTATPTQAAPPVAPAAPALVLRPLRPREVLFVARSACGADVRAFCPAVAPGGGRIVECLVSHSASLSPACREVLSQFAAR